MIALIITIIVLLILAGVSIAMLTGDNGILRKATDAKETNEQKSAEELVKLAIMGSYGEDGKINLGELKKNLNNISGITGVPDSITEESFPFKVLVDGQTVEISKSETGVITAIKQNVTTPSAPDEITKIKVEQAIESGTALSTTKNKIITDSYGNSIKIPAGFKIASDSATEVTGGIVIEDTSTATAGNQFVWIPVGKIYTDVEKTETNAKTIELGRYTFNRSTGKESPYTGTDYLEEDSTDTANLKGYGNTIARDINEFKSKAEASHGYYIGRYEARKNSSGIITEVSTDTVYNCITQPNAAVVARTMYGEDKPLTSDLMNSYAWDTAILFEQTFGTNSKYSDAYSVSASLSQTGTTTDVQCNIYDMAGNLYEWSTETSSSFYCDWHSPCVARGGRCWHQDGYTSYRNNALPERGEDSDGFRPILYL